MAANNAGDPDQATFQRALYKWYTNLDQSSRPQGFFTDYGDLAELCWRYYSSRAIRPDWKVVCAAVICRWVRQKVDDASNAGEDNAFLPHIAVELTQSSLGSYFNVDPSTVSRHRTSINDYVHWSATYAELSTITSIGPQHMQNSV